MENPKISVIVPVYNVEQYLPRCIDSILAQTFTDFELLLIDDGSKDRSGGICDEYAKKDSRIKVFHKENGGVSSARNLGLRKAKGEYISFIDSDDWIEINYLEEIISNIDDSDIMFFSFRWNYEDGCSKIISYGDRFVFGTDEIEKCILFLKSNNTGLNLFGYTWNKVFKADVIRKNDIKFIEKLDVSEDEIFTLAFCTNSKKLKIISAMIYNYRWTDNGLTHAKKTESKWRMLIFSLEPLIELLHNEKLIYTYRQWHLGILLTVCNLNTSWITYIKNIGEACKYAHRYNLSNYKKRIMKNILQRIYSHTNS